MSSAPTTPPSVDKVDGFSRKSVRKARQKRSQSSSQFRSQGKPIELTPLPLLKGLRPRIFQYVTKSTCFYFLKGSSKETYAISEFLQLIR
ncbi:Ppp2r5e [Phodopus roborovskii]|uniref:Ppp2r5e protein n=1 Tax=Phodopus roborovskii TaxID=109678 RepID=A0AAU9ZQB7_PHORO|nr:Ppp2r5e [Phodopus roborovskii]